MMMMPLNDIGGGAHAMNSNYDDDGDLMRIQQQSHAPPTRVSVSEDSISKSCRKNMTLLPAEFKPGNYSVILGRGKVNSATGNRRLKIIASLHLPAYVAAKSRREKSYVVARVLEIFQQCNDNVGAFIRKDTESGCWYEVDDSMAREKIGVVFRDLSPAGQYRSSTKNKVARRRQRKEERSAGKSIMPQPDPSSSYYSPSPSPSPSLPFSPQTSSVTESRHQTTASRSLSIVDFDFSSIQQEHNQNIHDQENDYVSLSDDDFAAAFR